MWDFRARILVKFPQLNADLIHFRDTQKPRFIVCEESPPALSKLRGPPLQSSRELLCISVCLFGLVLLDDFAEMPYIAHAIKHINPF